MNNAIKLARIEGAKKGLAAVEKIYPDLYDDIESLKSDFEDDRQDDLENLATQSPLTDDDLESDDVKNAFFEAYNAPFDARLESFETEINERIFEKDLDTVRSLWPEVRAMIVAQYGEKDEIALNQGFNEYTDSLCKDGQISGYTYDKITEDDL